MFPVLRTEAKPRTVPTVVVFASDETTPKAVMTNPSLAQVKQALASA